jgi:hypothetical protein
MIKDKAKNLAVFLTVKSKGLDLEKRKSTTVGSFPDYLALPTCWI